jgi:hypothetical protein
VPFLLYAFNLSPLLIYLAIASDSEIFNSILPYAPISLLTLA